MSTQKSRRQKLEEMLLQYPNDPFTRYAIALEHLRENDLPAAESQFKALLEGNPDYVPGYQMYAQTLAQNTIAPKKPKLYWKKESTPPSARATSTPARKWKAFSPNSPSNSPGIGTGTPACAADPSRHRHGKNALRPEGI